MVEYLISIGYKPFRWTKKGLVECNNPHNYSTMVEGGLDVRLIKGKSVFIYGLNDLNKSPTLIYTRPIGINTDDLMNRYLNSNSVESVYNDLVKLSYETEKV